MVFKNQDLLKKIQVGMSEFSKGQKLIANFMLQHYEKAAYMTAAKLGDVVGVSESTVVRFAIELGFDGYPKLQKELKELIKNKLTSMQRMEVAEDRISEDNVLKSVLQSDMEKIKMTMEELDVNEFNAAVETILGAKRLYILGVRSAAPLASFMGFYFNLLFDNIRLVHTTSVSEMFEQIVRVGEGDVVIGISFPRYSKRTIKAMEFVKSQGASVVAITDSNNSPLAQVAHHSLVARSDMASFVDSLVAPLSLINALIVAIGMRRKDEIMGTLEKLETIWDEYQVYDKSEQNGESNESADF